MKCPYCNNDMIPGYVQNGRRLVWDTEKLDGAYLPFTEKGRFVNMPSTSYTDKDGNKQYSDTFHAITKSARTAVNQAVLNAYDLKLQQVQQTDIEVENTPDEEMSKSEDEPEPELSM